MHLINISALLFREINTRMINIIANVYPSLPPSFPPSVIFTVNIIFLPAGEVDEDDLSRLSAKALAQHFEKTIEGATPRKQVKVDWKFSLSVPRDVFLPYLLALGYMPLLSTLFSL